MQQRVFGGRWVGASLAAQHHLARYKGGTWGVGGLTVKCGETVLPAHSGGFGYLSLCCPATPTAVTPGVTETQPKAQKTPKKSLPLAEGKKEQIWIACCKTRCQRKSQTISGI